MIPKDPITFVVQEGGRLPPAPRNTVVTILKEFAGKKLRLKFIDPEQEPDTTSDKQRRYYFAVIVPAYMEKYKVKVKEDMHEDMMWNIGGFGKPYVSALTGEPQHSRKSINDLTTAEAEGYFTLCRAYAAENGFDIPEPNETDYDYYIASRR